MKFQVLIIGATVQLLLDSGSSDNFLQLQLAIDPLPQIIVEPIPNFQVLVGNCNAHVAEGLVRELSNMDDHIYSY